MAGAGLFPGDIAVLGRERPSMAQLRWPLLGGKFAIKRYRKKGARIWLQAKNPAFDDILLNQDSVFEVWEVIVKSIRLL